MKNKLRGNSINGSTGDCHLPGGGSIPSSRSIKDQFYIDRVAPSETHEWLLKKHYAHRLPMAIEYAFGLFDENKVLKGVCVFGPTAPPVPITLFGEIGKYKVRELTRLVINEELGKNILSYFVGNCLKLLPGPLCIISFADKKMCHHGYIYQATNFVYTGSGGQKYNFVDDKGNEIHSLTINDLAAKDKVKQEEYIAIHSIKKVLAEPKYRYLYFIGNKKEKKQMQRDLKLSKLPYPKGDNKRYDAGYKPAIQNRLF